MKVALAFLLILVGFSAFAEGRCPPGQYPIGDDRAPGCAPIPGAGGGADAAGSPVPTGKWETRWGAIAEDKSVGSGSGSYATGVSESRKSKKDASNAALDQCRSIGGRKCEILVAYYNQCVALADPTAERRAAGGDLRASFARAEKVEQAKKMALERCNSTGANQTCEIVYSGCSMSEFKAF